MAIFYPLNYGQVTWRHQQGGAAGESVFTCGVDLRTAAGFQSALDTCSSTYGSLFNSQRSSSCSYIGAALTALGDDGLTRWESFVGAGAGAQSGQAPPANVAVLIRKRTALAGRKHRGRMYWPGVAMANLQGINSNLLTDTQLSDWTTKWHTFFTTLTDASIFPVILHQSSIPVPTPIIQFELQQRVATQRGRLRD